MLEKKDQEYSSSLNSTSATTLLSNYQESKNNSIFAE